MGRSRHKWGLESAEDQIVILASTVNDPKDDNLKLAKALSQKFSNKGKQAPVPGHTFEGGLKPYAQ
eukprot:3927740-Ditylum_brightwellii.AAC.1